MRSAYEVLGLDETETDPLVIREAFRLRAKVLHPDRLGGNYARHFILVRQAYNILVNSDQRANFGRTPLFPDYLKGPAIITKEHYNARAELIKAGGPIKGQVVQKYV